MTSVVGPQITLNGAAYPWEAPQSVQALLDQLQLKAKFVAVELNRELIPRARHALVEVCPGDVIEVVTLTGGG